MKKSAAFGISHFPFWKAALGGAYLSVFITGLAWLFNSILLTNWKHPLSPSELAAGFIIFPLYLWVWWASRKREKFLWMYWLSNLILSVYMSLLVLVEGVFFSMYALSSPWGEVLVGLQLSLVVSSLILFVISPRTFGAWFFEKSTKVIGWLGLLLGGSGTSGALFGMYAVRHGHFRFAQFVLGLFFWILGTYLFLNTLHFLYQEYPWAKEGEE